MSDLLDRTLGMLQPLDPSSPSRALDLSELEERILLSASPVMAVAEMVEAAPADSMSAESAMASVADSAGSLSAAENSQQTEQTGSTVTTNPTATATRELVFLDTSVEDYQTLLNDLWANDDPSRELEVVLLSNSHDGIDQISEALAERSDIDSIHFVTHGTDRAVKLGSTWLTNDNLAGYAGEMARWGDALSADADLLFYGCNLAGSDSGLTLLESVQALTGADIAASTDDTGTAVLGGDWDLEVELGSIESSVVFSEMAQADWRGLLNTFTVTNTNDSGAGSLRQAITDANSLGGLDTIEFNIGGGGAQTIALTSAALPTISDALIIDGSTQGGFVAGTPLIEIDGSALGGSTDGLTITAGNSTIRGLMINGFTDDGIDILTNGGNTIVGNWIGTDGTASPLPGNADDGIDVNSGNNLIGGTTLADRNVITNNASSGIVIEGSGATGNIVIGNYIGLDPNGSSGLGNGGDGITIQTSASNNIIGGAVDGAGNVISANTSNGVELASGATGNRIQGNLIGTAANGTTDKGNTGRGIRIQDVGTDDNLIGGTEDGSGNVIAFSNNAGIRTEDGVRNSFLKNTFVDNSDIGIDLNNDGVTTNDSGDGDSGANNLQNFPVLSLAQSTGDGTIGISGTLNSSVSTTYRIEFFVNSTNMADIQAEEFLGSVTATTDGSGNADFVGVFYETVTVGHFITATATVDNDDGTFGDTSEVAANQVVTAIPVITVDTTSETIDGPTSSFTNLAAAKGGDNAISLPEAIQAANATAGIELIEFNIAGAGPHTIAITSALPTITGPVIIDGSTQEDFGGNDNAAVDELTTGPEIIIDADATSGVAGFRIEGDGVTLRSIGVTNTHGTSVSGSGIYVNGDYFSIDDVTVANSGVVGIFVLEISHSSITNSVSRNNGLEETLGDGIAIQGPLTDITVSGNTLINNAAFGLDFASGATTNVTVTSNLIKNNGSGGSVQQAGIGIRSGDDFTIRNNTITGNMDDGIVVTNGHTGHFFSQNLIYGNGELGIDLSNGTALTGDEVTANDARDSDSGGNNLQNYPGLTTATTADGQTTIAGSFSGAANTEFLIEFFSSATADGSGFGEARRYLGSTTITTNGSGTATISEVLDAPTGVGAAVTATASVDDGAGSYDNTSEFAQNVTVTGTSVITVTTTSDTADGDTSSIEALFADRGADNRISLREAILAADSSTNGVSVDEIRFNIPSDDANFNAGNGTWLIQPATALPFISGGVTIDATTQTGYAGTPLFDLDGGAIAAPGADGFETDAGDITIKGFVIRNFDGAGIDIQDGSDNIIESNYIDTDVTGTVAQANGIEIKAFGGADVTTIGDLSVAQANIIAFNTGDGIEVDGAGAVSIYRNSIFSNGALGIDLVTVSDPVSSVTANDVGDGDNGSNALQNYPVLAEAITDGSTEIDIAGSINTTASENVLIQFYANDSNDGTGYGEGQTYLGFTNVTTGSDGNATFDITLNAVVSDGAFISATATNSEGSTSEFALSLAAQLNNSSPVITSDGGGAAAGVNVPENTTTVTNTDADGGTPAYSINGRADAARFSIDSSSGDLTFDTAPDFEIPTDADTDNVYEVTVQVSDGAGGIDSQAISVTITGVNESPTFLAGDGIVVTDVRTDDDTARSVVVQPDGKIVTGGYAEVGGVNQFALTRYNTDGTLDSTFGTSGVVTTSFGGITNFGYHLAIQGDGKLLLAGGSFDGTQWDYALARYNSDGTLDTSFNGDRFVETPIGSGDDRSWAISLQSDGGVLVGGYTDNGSDYDYALVRDDSR